MKKRFNTKVIHSGHGTDKETGGVMPPIHLSTTFKQNEPGEFKYEYARTKNPSRDVLEKLLAELESGEQAFAFASGMAAINTVCDIFGSDYHIICSDDVYGGTRRLFDKVKSNIDVTYIDFDKNVNWDEIVSDRTKFIWLETPSNPLMKIIDIKNTSTIANDYNLPVICDNTFASPFNQRPLELGADLVVSSSTKYLGGHSDIVGGSITLKNSKKYLILGDMLELGKNSLKQHKLISKIVNKTNINQVYVKGNYIKETFKGLNPNKKAKILTNKFDIIDLINKNLNNSDYLMIKGSNSTGLHKITNNLKQRNSNVV